MIHGGCEVNTPWRGDTAAYTEYGPNQNAENIVFYGKVLALMTRAKVYNDLPDGWQDFVRLNDAAVFGDIWKQYYGFMAARSDLPFWSPDRKMTYWWSTVGDYSLRFRYGR